MHWDLGPALRAEPWSAVEQVQASLQFDSAAYFFPGSLILVSGAQIVPSRGPDYYHLQISTAAQAHSAASGTKLPWRPTLTRADA